MRETLMQQAFNAIGPLKSPEGLKELADRQALANGELPGPQFTNPGQALAREVLVRGVAHPLLFRHSSEMAVPDGLERFHQIIKKGDGGIIVNAHYSRIDPTWALNDTTERLGLRNIDTVFPIRWDRAPDILLKIGNLIGSELVRVVTPAAWENAKKTGNPHNLQEMGGYREFRTRTKRVVKEGGIAVMESTPERQSVLTVDQYNSIGILIFELITKGSGEFGIHFYASRIPNTKDYDTRRGYNQFKRHVAVHGETYTGNELWQKAQKMIPEEIQEKKERNRLAIENVSKIVFDELKGIADPNFLPSEIEE